MIDIYKTPPRARLATYKPSSADRKTIHDGLGYLSMTTAFWSSMFYKMQLAYSYAIPLAATDAHTVFVNPPAMRELGWTVENVAFVEAHEVCHYIMSDLIMAMGWRELGYMTLPDGTTLPYDAELMNKAMDYRINAVLIDGKVGVMPREGLFDPKYSAKGMESCLEIYAKLWAELQQQQLQSPQAQPQQGSGQGGSGFDQHIEPSQAALQDEQGAGAAKRAQHIASALQAAEAAGMGELPAAIKRLIDDILQPQVHWEDHLASTMKRAAGQPKHDWSKVNKRLISRPDKIVFARKSNYGCGPIVVGWDSSGSTHEHQAKFFAEMSGIVGDLNPSELIVIRCDTKVHGYDVLEEPQDLNAYRTQINEEGIGGGGGTNFVPVFDRIRDEGIEPDMLVFFTDTYGRFPDREPTYPVIWASIVKQPTVPWGQVVEIEKE